MNNSNLLIGLIWFYILAQLCLNIWGGREMYSNASVYPFAIENSDNSSFFQTDQTVDDLENSIMVPKIINDIWTALRRIFTYDFPLFHNDDGTDNEFVILRWLLTALAVVMWIDLFIAIKRR